MTSAMIVLALVLLLVAAIAAVVIIGGNEAYAKSNPLARELRRANAALNGEGDVPEPVNALFR